MLTTNKDGEMEAEKLHELSHQELIIFGLGLLEKNICFVETI